MPNSSGPDDAAATARPETGASTSTDGSGAGAANAVPRRVWWALVAMLSAAAMDLIDTTIVNVAAPAIRAELAASAAQLEWAVAGYALAFGLGLIPAARLGDRLGRRPVFLTGVAGFVLASLACGTAPGADVLVAARVAQGLAAAVMIPQILTVIQVAIPAAQRAKAFAGYGATAAIGTVSGPLLGGLLIAADPFGLGWRSIFLINIPIGLLRLLYVQRVREHAYGGIPGWVLAEFDRVLVESRKPRENTRVDTVRRSLSVGTRLVREWNGKTISIEVRQEGYLYADKLYGSLSEIARVVTGAHWSGPRFFGIKRRG